MKEKDIRPIPKNILKRIKLIDKTHHPIHCGNTRYYAYWTTWKKELIKVTVAVRDHKKLGWIYKQIAVHGVHTEECYIKDFVFYYVGGYVVGWHAEGDDRKKWFETGDWGEANGRIFDPWAYLVNPKFPLRLSEYKYCAIDKYQYEDVLKYIRLYEKYPQMEYLVKLGLSHLATSKQILDLAKKDKAFRKWLGRNANEIKPNHYISSVINAYKTGNSIEETERTERLKKKFATNDDYKSLRNLFKGKEIERFFLYLQAKGITAHDYRDYISACRFLNIDLTQEKNLLPHDFKHWHDTRIDEMHSKQAEIDRKEREEFYKQFDEIAQKYLRLQNQEESDYITIIARSPVELKNEGIALHHCVGRMGYDQKFAREETLIFFIREKAHADIPFVTLEYSLKKKEVLQCYGLDNTRPKQEVMDYVYDKWLPFANQQLKQIKAAA